MSEESENFPIFTLFPKEIRLEIWEHSIEPRVITFEFEHYNFNPRRAPQHLYLVGGDPPYTHFEIDVPQRPTSPYYIVQACPRVLASPPLLSTCRESREVALRCGYRFWTIENQVLGRIDMMWNPSFDFVSLELSSLNDKPFLDVFVEQFPEQVKQIRHLAFWLPSWPEEEEEDVALWLFIPRFSKLAELAVIIEPYDWHTPEDLAEAVGGIKTSLTAAKDDLMQKATLGNENCRALESWYPSKVRLVGGEHQLLSEV